MDNLQFLLLHKVLIISFFYSPLKVYKEIKKYNFFKEKLDKILIEIALTKLKKV